MLAIAICYVWSGDRVPWYWYPAVIFVTAWCAWCTDLCLRSSDEEAASFADRFFGLKNSVRSCLKFSREERQGGFYDLQSAQTAALIQESNVADIRYQPPWKLIVPGVAFVAAATLLGLKPESPQRIAEKEQQQQTLAMTSEANREIEELIEELEDSIDEDEKLMLEPDKLRQWVDELKETTDLREAKRQYAKMEMRLNRAYEALEQRKDEKLLDKAADELDKDLDSTDLSKDLKHKKYERAADKLKDLKPEDLKNKKLDPKDLGKSRKELAKLKAIAKRMAAAAENTQGDDGDEEESDDADDDDLAEMIEDLDEAIEGLDEELEELELQDGDGEQDLEQGDLDEAQAIVRGKLDELGDHLMKMARRRGARSKLRKLSKKCAACQNSETAKGKGGKRPGQGSDDAIREQRDENIDNGQYAKLKGLKGKGPSQTQVQAADDGDGTSRIRSKVVKREFKRQFESFVDREDIPEDLKAGVKEYFTNIHQAEEPSNGDPSMPDAEPDR